MTRPRVAIIGCGLIGQKRAHALGGAQLVACSDIQIERARAVAASGHDVAVSTSWQETILRDNVDIVVVATTNQLLGEISEAAAANGRHVLVEKPAGRNTKEIDSIIAAAKRTGALVRVGFNHRFHPALQKAREIVDSGAIGDLMFVRGRYGHGGRVGYEKEWRADPTLAGGGEMIDQGVHLIDLARWFLGEFTTVQGFAHTYFWDMPVDDNGFMLLRTEADQTAFLHVSCTEWKNLFSFEIYGRTGKLAIDGLGGSYGVERLTHYAMLPQMGPPDTTIWEYPRGDLSWKLEFEEFLTDIAAGSEPAPGLADARAALEVVETIYRGSGYDHHS